MSGARRTRLRDFFLLPATELLGGLDRCLAAGARGLALVGAGLLAGWWLYVPLHELLHAAGCVAAGGSVSRLEIDALYGGAVLQRLFPFVTVGSEYAGRLSGFDTAGSDWIYLATDLAPFLLTLLPGIWWLRRSGRSGQPFLFGASLPFALAPFLSLTGDAYEIGSLAAVHLPPARGVRALVGDDVVRKAGELDLADPVQLGGFVLAIVLGLFWCFGWSAAARWIAERLGEPPIEPVARAAASGETGGASR
ncbi:MAG: hypothetical protein AB7G12_12970 [Thermoanaerobaculia bacterium]